MPAAPPILSNSVPILLIPPSEGKATVGTGRPWNTSSGSFGSLGPERAHVVAALADADGGSEKLLGVTGERLEQALEANRHLIGSPGIPAWRRYTGVVWEHLDPSTLSPEQRRRLVIPSALLGLVRGDDPVPLYRLKMGARLSPLGTMSRWWRPSLTRALDRRVRGRVVVDLLPREHRSAWASSPRTRGVRVEFVERSGAPGGHFAKAAKGRLARAVLECGAEAIEGWEDDRFDLSITDLGGG